jgi:hypothetical protein
MINSQKCSNHESVFLIEELYKDRPSDWTCPGEDINLACRRTHQELLKSRLLTPLSQFTLTRSHHFGECLLNLQT